jgi:Fic family protein
VRIGQIGKAAPTALKVHSYLVKKPYLSLTKAAKELDISVPTITNTVAKLEEIGVLKELTGKRVIAYLPIQII